MIIARACLMAEPPLWSSSKQSHLKRGEIAERERSGSGGPPSGKGRREMTSPCFPRPHPRVQTRCGRVRWQENCARQLLKRGRLAKMLPSVPEQGNWGAAGRIQGERKRDRSRARSRRDEATGALGERADWEREETRARAKDSLKRRIGLERMKGRGELG